MAELHLFVDLRLDSPLDQVLRPLPQQGGLLLEDRQWGDLRIDGEVGGPVTLTLLAHGSDPGVDPA